MTNPLLAVDNIREMHLYGATANKQLTINPKNGKKCLYPSSPSRTYAFASVPLGKLAKRLGPRVKVTQKGLHVLQWRGQLFYLAHTHKLRTHSHDVKMTEHVKLLIILMSEDVSPTNIIKHSTVIWVEQESNSTHSDINIMRASTQFYMCAKWKSCPHCCKTHKPLWLTVTRGPSLLGSLPSGDTGRA